MSNDVKKNIYLSGGGSEHASYSLDRLFFAAIPQGGTLLYLSLALRGHRLFEGAENWFKGIMRLHNRHGDIVLETWDSLDEKNFSDLKRFNGIYIGGGNTWNLMRDITESGFKEVLCQYIKHGGVYYGGSAGAIICGAYIDTQTDENIDNLQDAGGMNLLNGFSVTCHVTQEQFSTWEDFAKEKHRHLLALGEDAGAVFDGESFQCVGDGICKEI